MYSCIKLSPKCLRPAGVHLAGEIPTWSIPAGKDCGILCVPLGWYADGADDALGRQGVAFGEAGQLVIIGWTPTFSRVQQFFPAAHDTNRAQWPDDPFLQSSCNMRRWLMFQARLFSMSSLGRDHTIMQNDERIASHMLLIDMK